MITSHLIPWLSNLIPDSCHGRASWRNSRSETPDQNFTPEGQDFRTAGMCPVKTWGCLGSWKPPHGIKDNCWTLGYGFKNKPQWPACLKNHLGKNVPESSNYVPTGVNYREGKREKCFYYPFQGIWQDKKTKEIQNWLPQEWRLTNYLYFYISYILRFQERC